MKHSYWAPTHFATRVNNTIYPTVDDRPIRHLGDGNHADNKWWGLDPD